jgi:hypothetical protein
MTRSALLSRRRFFGLVAAAAAAPAVPRPLVGLLEPAEAVFYVDPAGWTELPPSWTSPVNMGFLHGMPYWVVAENSGTYMGLERSKRP